MLACAWFARRGGCDSDVRERACAMLESSDRDKSHVSTATEGPRTMERRRASRMFAGAAAVLAGVTLTVGCGGGHASTADSTTSAGVATTPRTFTQRTVAVLAHATDTAQIRNARVVGIVGHVSLVQRTKRGNLAVQMWTDAKRSHGNVLVILRRKGPAIHKGDYLEVDGRAVDVFAGRNRSGAVVKVPRIAASRWRLVHPTAAALGPTTGG